MREQLSYKTKWIVRKYAGPLAFAANQPYEVAEIDGNLLLNEGIGELWDLVCDLGTPTAFSNANAYIGVGDSDTAAAAAQTGLQASSNKAYAAMESGYPQRNGQKVTFRAVFDGDTANFAWKEFSVANGNSDSAKNLNRKVSDQGTKGVGQTWTVDLEITLS